MGPSRGYDDVMIEQVTTVRGDHVPTAHQRVVTYGVPRAHYEAPVGSGRLADRKCMYPPVQNPRSIQTLLSVQVAAKATRRPSGETTGSTSRR